MSDYEMNEGQIFIFSTKPEGNKPTVKGKLKINGQEYEIGLWPSKSGKAGSYSGKVSLPFKKKEKDKAQTVSEMQNEIDDNMDIPF